MSFGTGAAQIGVIGIGVIGWLVALVASTIALARHRLPPLHGYAELPVVGPVLQRVWNRLGPLTFPLRARLGVNGVALVALLLGLGVVVTLAVGFTALLDDVLEGGGLAQFDDPAAVWLAGHRELWLTNALLVITRMGNPGSQTLWITVVCLVAAVTARSWAPILVGLAGGLGISLVIVVAKRVVGRPRPPQPYALLSPHGLSFPSGHAAGAAAVGVLCAWMLCRWVVRRWPLQIGVWSVTVAAVGLIGFSRPYLGVHFVTDVLAGWLLGAAWAGSVILLAAWWLGSQRPSRAAGNSVTPRC